MVEAPAGAIGRGPGRLLVAVYLLFAIAAGARAGLQLATKFSAAPIAYLLSALAAAIYIAATIGLVRGGSAGRRTALICCTIELIGVIGVGLVSLLRPQLFPDDTVWSGFGSGYGYVPLVLPVLGLLWIRHIDRQTNSQTSHINGPTDRGRVGRSADA